MPNRPLVSVVTPTLNQAPFIESTLASVRGQTYPKIEHIVVDGGSTDETLELLRAASENGAIRYASGPDRGMYDAVNKGLALATGEIMAYLNSDDVYLPWAVESVVRIFESRPGVDLVFGDGIKVEQQTGVQRLRLFPPFDRVSLSNYESLMQPAVFWRRSLFERLGGFDASLRFVADLDFWLRAAEAGATIVHIDEVLAVERLHETRLSVARKDAMAAEDAEMRARHAGAEGGPAGRERAKARDLEWQVKLFRRFVLASMLRRLPLRLPGPWSRFLHEGRTRVRWRLALQGSKPHQGKLLRNAVRSGVAAAVLVAKAPELRLEPEEARRRKQDGPDRTAPAPVSYGHGHTLLERRLPKLAASAPRGHIVEIGSTREKRPGQESTMALAALADRLGMPFVTVDMDPVNTEQARADLAAFANARAVTAKGEDFLASFDKPVLAAYLDAFDIQHGEHPEYRAERYRELLGTEITNEGASAMHLACAQALRTRVVPGGLVVIDDTWPTEDGWEGKGSAAVPALLSSGFKVIARTRTAVALKRKRRRPLPVRVARRAVRPLRVLVEPARRTARRAAKAARNLPKAYRYRRRELTLALTYRFSREGRRSRETLERLRDSAAGRRCVIIGNGPSLNQMDLSVLKDVDTFGLNRGYLLFPRIGGPTTYLVSANRYVLEQSMDEMLAAPSPKFFNWRHRQHVPAGRDDVAFLHTVHAPGFSRDIPGKGLWEGATVTYVAMQLAFHMGYRDVVLIGVDHSFSTPGPAHKLVTSEGADPNHFDPSYFGAGYRWQLPDLEMSERAYRMAKAAFEAAGGSIVDATVGGKLTIFPKADFSTLFPVASTTVPA